MPDWVEVVVPVGAADVDDVAALIASEVKAAAAGTEQRGDEVVFWVDAADAASALAETRDAVARWAAGGAAVDPARVRTAMAMPEAEWRDAWKRYFKVSRLTRQFVVVPSWSCGRAPRASLRVPTAAPTPRTSTRPSHSRSCSRTSKRTCCAS